MANRILAERLINALGFVINYGVDFYEFETNSTLTMEQDHKYLQRLLSRARMNDRFAISKDKDKQTFFVYRKKSARN